MESTEKFFERMGLVFLRRSRVADPRVSELDWGTLPYYQANQQEFESSSKRYGNDLRSGYRPSLWIRDSGRDIGWGLYCATDLQVGDLVGEYTGVIQAATDAPSDQLVDGHYLSDYAWNYPDELPDGSEFEVNAFHEGNELRFANHSSRPNLAVDHTLIDGLYVTFFRVIRAIPAGEQLTVDYGLEYWQGGFRERVEL